MPPYFVSTPIYYVNDLPHVGHIYTTVVADAVARYHRMAGDEVFFLTGTDEHGQKIERAAQAKDLEPLALADRVVERYHELWGQLGISHDDFVRTTEPRHHRAVEAIVARMAEAGDLYTGHHEGWYCTGCETFYTEKELDPEKRCPVHEEATEWKSEENVYFRLSKYQQPLLDWYRDNPEAVRPASRANEVRGFVEAGLRDLSVSRANVSWGVPFPGHPGQTVYVWLDALTNYVSALGYGAGGERYERHWTAPGSTRIHLVGKDILRFHAVYWPAFLMAAGLPLPTSVIAHGWWLRDERKVSKSAGNVVRPDEIVERFGADGLRYFLLREMVFGQDASFSDEAFVDRFNGDLANDLGNTLSRVVKLCRQAFDGKTPPHPCDDNPLIPVAEQAVAEYRSAMEGWAFERTLKSLWRLLAEANQYLVAREPWKLVKSEGPTPKLSRILWNSLEAVRIVATALHPVMPATAPRLLAAIGVEEAPQGLDALAWGGTPTDKELGELAPIFPRIDKKAYLAAPPPDGGEAGGGKGDRKELEPAMLTIDQFFETELRVANVTAAEPIPKSDKLLKLTVDLGGETRTLVAGIAQQYAPEEVVGRQVVIVANLTPAKLMGVESQGMVLAASDEGRPVLLHPAGEVPPGTRVR